MLWFSPRSQTFNLFGLLIAIWLLVGSAIAGALLPETILESMKWWTIYMATYLAIGAAILLWRKDRAPASTDDHLMLPRRRLAPAIWNSFSTTARYILPIWAIFAVVMAAVFFAQGQGLRAIPSALVFTASLVLPLALLAVIIWGISLLIDWINPNRE